MIRKDRINKLQEDRRKLVNKITNIQAELDKSIPQPAISKLVKKLNNNLKKLQKNTNSLVIIPRVAIPPNINEVVRLLELLNTENPYLSDKQRIKSEYKQLFNSFLCHERNYQLDFLTSQVQEEVISVSPLDSNAARRAASFSFGIRPQTTTTTTRRSSSAGPRQ